MAKKTLADNKIAVWIAFMLLVYAAFEATARTEESLGQLPVIVTKKLAANAPANVPAKSPTKIGGLYPVFVVSAQISDKNGSAQGTIPDAQLDRLFASVPAKPQIAISEPGAVPEKIALPAPGMSSGPPGRAPPGSPAASQAEAPPRLPPNMFRVDGITNGGAFITGRYFKVGDELEGIAFPVPLAPGEKAVLSGVSVAKITLQLGSRSLVLSRVAE